MVKRSLVAALLSALIAAPAGAASAPDNLMGETCARSTPDDIEAEPGLPGEELLTCGNRTAGRLRVMRAGKMAYPDVREYKAALMQSLRLARVQGEVMGPLICQAPRWIEDEGGHRGGAILLAVPCKQKNGGWPHLVLARLKDGVLLVADGAPANLPGLRALLGAPPVDDSRSAQSLVLRQVFGGSVPLATADDLSRFRERVNQARVANQKGLHGEAEHLLRDALDMQTRMLGEHDVSVGDTLLDLALLVSNQGRHEEAERLFNRASALIDTSARREDRARQALYRGFDAANRGQFGEALKYAQAAANTWRELVQSGATSLEGLTDGDPMSRNLERGELAFALNLVAQMAVRDQQPVLAQAAAAEALQILTTTDGLPPAWRADTLAALGEISIAQGRLSAAETYLNNAIAIRRSLFGDSPPVIRALATLGRAYQQEGMHTSAIVTFREVLKLADRLGAGAREILDEDDLIPFVESAHAYAAALDQAEKKQGVYAEVFAAFGLLRASVVERTISQTAQRLAQERPALAALLQALHNAMRAQDAARVQLALEVAAPDEARSGIAEAKLAQTIETTGKEIARLNETLRREHPDYQQLAQPAAPTLVEIQNALREGEALVAYLIGRKQGFALLVRRDGLHLARVGESRNSLAAAVGKLRRAMVLESNLMGSFDAGLAHQLHGSLLGGLGEGLRGIDHLVVAQSGALASLPFAVLLTRAPRGEDYRDYAWLGRDIALTSVPGMGAFHALRALPARTAMGGFLGLGDPLLTGPSQGENAGSHTLCRDEGPAAAARIRAMPPLPDTATELKRIDAMVGSRQRTRLLLGKEASETALRAEALDQYRVLYFASHAVLPGELKCATEPALVLTPPDAARNRAEDGLLEASEIAQLKLNADLVVLSACNTAGEGGKFGGDALSGLAEAFFHAGTRALVASHWQVPSRATAELMSHMFEEIGPDFHTDPAQALRQAQQRLMSQPETAHPFFWGAFVVVGDSAKAAPPAGLAAAGGAR